MATKLGRNEFPAGMSANDFKCYGPPATKDTEFSGSRIADMGCFQQEAVDSNKYYHCAMVTDKNNKWYLYVEYGRVGASNPSFQFTECYSEADCQSAFEKQCAEKNTKRGEWVTLGGVKLFRPKVKNGKPDDVYVVRDLAKRDVGLPDAKTIASPNQIVTAKPVAKTGAKKSYRCDAPSTALMRDLLGGAVTFTRTTIQGGTIPAQTAIDKGRELIQEALQRISVVGNDVKKQIQDKDMRQLSYALYGLIPKIKPLHCADEDWILSDYTNTSHRQSTIGIWTQDLDAFETALKAGDVEETIEGDDPLATFPSDFHMESIDQKSELGQYLMQWWPAASRNRHHGVGPMKLKNLWKIRRGGDEDRFKQILSKIKSEIKGEIKERPDSQDKKRPDLTIEERKDYWDNNCGLLFHGSASVNVPGILREHFRVPKDLVGVAITGAMFGAFGTYLACDWRKSDGYTSRQGSYWSGGRGLVKGRQAFMFACDAILGQPYVAPGPQGFTKPPTGYHCVFGKSKVSQVQNNEWVVVPSQINQRFLAEYTI